ncbi:DEAD/DEAH box helicase family protein [Lactobacillus sp.]|uniref:DEAD/DEAH box helicase family protein n=1 Tax=Lactobacillus sp. TaxID=1591 RepID=UPI0019897633|nr:DEAD/DEAH box helicase family protein [Lactobacillus sp.]MBD5429327.1 DEAD/DEAH box helicase family protein [Lactobacillus sp.]
MYKLFDYQQNLVDRARNSLASGNRSVLIVSAPGSGKSVVIAEIARLAALKGNQVLFMVHRKELVEQIKNTFIKQGVDLSHTAIMTVGKIANRLGKIAKPTLIITDETHHSLAKTYRKIYDYYKDVPRLGFTATPVRLSGKGLHDVYDDMIVGKSVKWLIENDHLAPYTLYSYKGLDTNQLKRSSTGDYTQKSMDNMAKQVIYGDIVENWKDKAKHQKTIIYCHAVWFSKKVAKAFQDAGINAIHVDSKTPAEKREQIMQDFKTSKIQILCNVNLISEGFDVPDCSCVVLLRPTMSLVVYLQQAMRCMRYQKNKNAIIIDQVGNCFRHGLPDDAHKWTLRDITKQAKRKQSPNTVHVQTCPHCFAVVKSGVKICPICGFELKERKQEIEINKKAKLSKIFKVKRPKPHFENIDDLKNYAKENHYKTGWIFYQAKARGWIK